MSERDDYLRAINYDFENDAMVRSLMNTIAYFYLFEGLLPKDNDLIKYIINKQDRLQISHLSNYHWRSSEKLTEPHRDLVIDLWDAIMKSGKAVGGSFVEGNGGGGIVEVESLEELTAILTGAPNAGLVRYDVRGLTSLEEAKKGIRQQLEALKKA